MLVLTEELRPQAGERSRVVVVGVVAATCLAPAATVWDQLCRGMRGAGGSGDTAG